jgi:hypothetical protein
MGPILDTVVISHDVGGMLYEDSGDAYSFLLCLYTAPVETRHFATLVTTPQGYKASSHSCTTYIFSHDLPPSPHLLPNV